MGAMDFTVYQDGTDIAQAFRDAVENAQYEYGHRGYTGTIAEKDEYQTVSDTALSMDDAEALADRIMRDYEHPLQDKWGPAGAIPVLRGGPAEHRGWLFFGCAAY